MHIERFDPVAEPDKVRACYQIYVAGLPVDDPEGPPFPEHTTVAWFEEGFGGEPRETVLATDSSGAPVGWYLLELPHKRNKHLGYLDLVIAPDKRRHGYGTALLRHAAKRAAADGRTILTADTRRGSPGSGFAAAMRARAGVVAIRRVLEMDSIPAGKLAELRAKAEVAAQGYSLLRWTGLTPEEDLLGVATVRAAMADAPHNPGEEPHGVDPERVHYQERRMIETGMRRYTVAARCNRTGELAGLTQMGVDPQELPWARQFITAVSREHRGHRLGLLVKLDMLDMLTAAEPDVRHILTDNADANQHMIAINAELGYRILDEQQSWELDVATVMS
jgi:GNAT superfamily N-acetyltransferase